MKKILFIFSFLVGLLSLASCDDNGGSANITYVDSNGAEQTLKVTATDNQEVVTKVVEYAAEANYENITSFTAKADASLNASLSKDISSLIGSDKAMTITGSFTASANASQADGVDAALGFDFSMGNLINASMDISTIYNGKLEEAFNEGSTLYVAGSYNMMQNGLTDSSSVKYAYKLAEFLEGMGDLDEFLPGMTDVPNYDGILSDLNASFVISSVKNGTIYLESSISIKDLLSSLKDVTNEEIAEIKDLLGNMDSKLVFSYGIEAQTGRFTSFEFTFNDVTIANKLFAYIMSSEMPSMANLQMIDKFEFKLAFSLSFNNAKVKSLTQAEKDQYVAFTE